VIAEAVTARVLADAYLEKFAGDSLREALRNWQGYLDQIGLSGSRKDAPVSRPGAR
jgi:chorismate synthase